MHLTALKEGSVAGVPHNGCPYGSASIQQVETGLAETQSTSGQLSSPNPRSRQLSTAAMGNAICTAGLLSDWAFPYASDFSSI